MTFFHKLLYKILLKIQSINKIRLINKIEKISGKIVDNRKNSFPGEVISDFLQQHKNYFPKLEDFANKDKISNLLRFASTSNDTEEQTVSLKDYVGRMNKDQKNIYYVTADNYAAAKGSPHLEIFKEKNIEVLLLSDRVDEWLVANFGEFEEMSLKSIAKGDLEDLDSKEDKKKKEKTVKDYEKVITKVQKILENQVKEVKVSSRLSESPSCLVADENEMGGNMERIMKSMGQDIPDTKPILEINPKHPLVKKLKTKVDKDLVKVLFDQAVLSEGGQIKEPAEFVKRMNKLMLG